MVVVGSTVHTACSIEGTNAWDRRPNVPPPGFVMKFERRGGYFGWQDTFWIYSDGRVVNTAGKTARVQPRLVQQWMGIFAHVKAPVDKKKPSLQSLGMDCYHYLITVYEQGEARVVSSSCTDIYNKNGDHDTPPIEIGRIRNTLISLPWE